MKQLSNIQDPYENKIGTYDRKVVKTEELSSIRVYQHQWKRVNFDTFFHACDYSRRLGILCKGLQRSKRVRCFKNCKVYVRMLEESLSLKLTFDTLFAYSSPYSSTVFSNFI